MRTLRISYDKLWKLLIDRKIKKSQLASAIGSGRSTFAKLGRDESVSLPLLVKICAYLHCDIGDIMELIPEDEPRDA